MDYQNSVTDRLCRRCAIKWLLRVVFFVTHAVCWSSAVDESIGADFRRAIVAIECPRRITPHRAAPYEELDLRHEFANLFSGKSIKTAAM